MADRYEFKDPQAGRELAFTVVPTSTLEVVAHQRKASKPHVEHVKGSVERLGFLVPLVVVERDSKYVILDGQHRFLAAKALGVKEFPVVVVPGDVALRMMSLNVEKDPNIREKAYVALAIYKEFVEASPSKAEDDDELRDALEHIHYVTLGFAYEKAARLSGSSFEPVLKRCDDHLSEPLSQAAETRAGRAGRVLEAYDLVKSITAKVKEMGVENPYLSTQIMAFANPLRGKRGAGSFDDAFDKLIAKLEVLDENPGKLLGAAAGSAADAED